MADIGIAAIGNASNREYPPDEPRIVRQLVRLIGSAKTWQDMIEASDALFQVELRAKSLRDERKESLANDVARAALRQSYQAQALDAKCFDTGALRQASNGAGY